MPMVTFQPSGICVDVQEGTTILQSAETHGVQIRTTCGGKASCRECRVKILEGEDAISPMGLAEERVLGNVFFITRERLSCQTQVVGDGLVVEIPPPRQPKPKKKGYRPIRPKRA